MFSWFRPASKQLSELRQEVDELRRQVKALDEEWSDYYDRFRRLMAKMAKRDERAAGDNEVREDAPEGAVTTGSEALTASQQRINEQILSRRNRLPMRRPDGA
jgi:phage shock protein A